MPPKIKDHTLCPHTMKMKRIAGFSKGEQKQAEAKGLTLPDAVSFFFCAQCWSINPAQTKEVEKVSTSKV